MKDYPSIICFLLLPPLLTACIPETAPQAESATALSARLTSLSSIRIPHATIVYYDVSGSTAEELRAQLDALGPVGYDGYKGDATTRWRIWWDWPGFSEPACELARSTVSYSIEVVLPRWMPSRPVDTDLLDRWERYIQALRAHEEGHAGYVVAQIPGISDAIKNATCETADTIAGGILEEIRAHDVQYDLDTDHGKAQGARFPE